MSALRLCRHSICDPRSSLAPHFKRHCISSVVIDGYTPRPDEDMHLNYETVGPNYFRTMRIPLLQGRDFDERDDGRTQGVVIISQAMAQRYWGQW